MSKSTYPLKLPTSIKEAAAELARIDGVSLNQFIVAAVAAMNMEFHTFDAGLASKAEQVLGVRVQMA